VFYTVNSLSFALKSGLYSGSCLVFSRDFLISNPGYTVVAACSVLQGFFELKSGLYVVFLPGFFGSNLG
jgi:hypothetical protein